MFLGTHKRVDRKKFMMATRDGTEGKDFGKKRYIFSLQI